MRFPNIEQIVRLNRLQIDLYGGLFLGVDNMTNEAAIGTALELVEHGGIREDQHPTLDRKAGLGSPSESPPVALQGVRKVELPRYPSFPVVAGAAEQVNVRRPRAVVSIAPKALLLGLDLPSRSGGWANGAAAALLDPQGGAGPSRGTAEGPPPWRRCGQGRPARRRECGSLWRGP